MVESRRHHVVRYAVRPERRTEVMDGCAVAMQGEIDHQFGQQVPAIGLQRTGSVDGDGPQNTDLGFARAVEVHRHKQGCFWSKNQCGRGGCMQVRQGRRRAGGRLGPGQRVISGGAACAWFITWVGGFLIIIFLARPESGRFDACAEGRVTVGFFAWEFLLT